MSTPAPLLRLRELCLTFPEVREDPDGVGNPSFKVAGKILVMQVVNHHGDAKTAFWCKAREGAQLVLTTSEPESYFVPPYGGRVRGGSEFGWIAGWTGLKLGA